VAGIVEAYDVRITLQRRNGPDIVWGISNREKGQKDDDPIMVDIRRSLNGAGTATIVLPGTDESKRRWWADKIYPRDFIKIEARIARIPHSMSQPLRTIFFGFVESVQRGFTLGDGAFVRNTVIACIDSMGILESEVYNYWTPLNLSAGGSAIVNLGLKMGDHLGSAAEVADTVFRKIIYGAFSSAIKRGGVDWENTHGYYFSSYRSAIGIDFQMLAPEATSYKKGVEGVLDIPWFYEFFFDTMPTQLAAGMAQGEVKKSKQTGLTFQGANDTYADYFIIRPKPYPHYTADGGYDNSAWDGLRTIEALDDHSITVRRGAEAVFSVYSVIPSAFGNATGFNQAHLIDNMILDQEKYDSICGYRILEATTKQLATSLVQPLTGSVLSEAEKQNQYLDPTSKMTKQFTEILFSHNQFNDRFYSGTLVTNGDSRAQVGIKMRHNGFLYYIEGYNHSITPDSFTTTFELTRGMTETAYGDEFEQTLGRKRNDETASPTNPRNASNQGAGGGADAPEYSSYEERSREKLRDDIDDSASGWYRAD
jgi:hypothetical protein